MSAPIALAGPDDLDRVAGMVAAFAEATGQGGEGAPDWHAAVRPLLDGSPHGAVYLIGPARAPVGFLSLAFGWSLLRGGIAARIDALYVRSAVRRRGMAGGALTALAPALGRGGIVALGVEGIDDAGLERLFTRAGMRPSGTARRMDRALA